MCATYPAYMSCTKPTPARCGGGVGLPLSVDVPLSPPSSLHLATTPGLGDQGRGHSEAPSRASRKGHAGTKRLAWAYTLRPICTYAQSTYLLHVSTSEGLQIFEVLTFRLRGSVRSSGGQAATRALYLRLWLYHYYIIYKLCYCNAFRSHD